MLRDILILGLAVAVQTLPSQVRAVEASGQPFWLSATVEIVLLDVTVKDAAGGHISNLSKDKFRVYEDGVAGRRDKSLIVVEPDNVGVLAPSSENLLTLVTCYPFSYIGAAPQRFVLRRHGRITWTVTRSHRGANARTAVLVHRKGEFAEQRGLKIKELR